MSHRCSGMWLPGCALESRWSQKPMGIQVLQVGPWGLHPQPKQSHPKGCLCLPAASQTHKGKACVPVFLCSLCVCHEGCNGESFPPGRSAFTSAQWEKMRFQWHLLPCAHSLLTVAKALAKEPARCFILNCSPVLSSDILAPTSPLYLTE